MALDAYLRIKRGSATSLPHVCTNKCRFWEHRPTQSFVCRATHLVHECGEKCDTRAVVVEGQVCRLTGLEVGGPEQVFQWAKHPYGGRSRQTHRGQNMLFQTRRVRRGEDISRWTRWTVRQLVSGSARRKVREHRMRRASCVLQRVIRTSGTFSDCQRTIFEMVKANERTFTAGVSYTDPRIDMVSDRIVELCRNSGSVTQANVCAQTAACFMRMDQGHVVAGVELIPSYEFVRKYGPNHIHYPDLIGIRCSKISKANRAMTDRLVSSAGLPNMQSLL